MNKVVTTKSTNVKNVATKLNEAQRIQLLYVICYMLEVICKKYINNISITIAFKNAIFF